MTDREKPLKTMLSDEEDKVVDYVAEKLGITRAELTRLAVAHYVLEQESAIHAKIAMAKKVTESEKKK